MSKQEKIKYKGEEGFNSYYAEVFGERWERLKNSITRNLSAVEKSRIFLILPAFLRRLIFLLKG